MSRSLWSRPSRGVLGHRAAGHGGQRAEVGNVAGERLSECLALVNAHLAPGPARPRPLRVRDRDQERDVHPAVNLVLLQPAVSSPRCVMDQVRLGVLLGRVVVDEQRRVTLLIVLGDSAS